MSAGNSVPDGGTGGSGPGSSCGVCVIVPTRNESQNVFPLVRRVERAMCGRDVEVLFVDDSDDDTPTQVRRVARTSAIPVRLHHRSTAERTGGLAGAVLAGLDGTDKPYAVVMDGDLQHPPEVLPELVRVARTERADIVVASRRIAGGSSAGLSDAVRVLVSGVSTVLTRAMFPRRLRGVSDPMSGFFLVRPAAVDLGALRPDGFKILLEILARTPRLSRREVAFEFAERNAGESKASLQEGARFLRQLCRLWAARLGSVRGALQPRGVVARGAGFATVGLTGLLVNSGLMWLAVGSGIFSMSYLVAAVIATQGSSTWNFTLVDRFVYAGPKRSTALRRWTGFLAMSNLVLLLRIPVLALLVGGLGMHYLVANALTLLVGFFARFSGQERLSLQRR